MDIDPNVYAEIMRRLGTTSGPAMGVGPVQIVRQSQDLGQLPPNPYADEPVPVDPRVAGQLPATGAAALPASAFKSNVMTPEQYQALLAQQTYAQDIGNLGVARTNPGLTGGTQQPTQAPVAPGGAQPSMPPSMPVSAQGDLPPAGSLAQVQQSLGNLTREEIQLKAAKGNLDSALNENIADIQGAANAFSMDRFGKMVQRTDQSRSMRDYFQAQSEQHIMTMQQQLGQAPSTTAADVMGLIAGIMAGSGRGGAAPALMQGLSGIMMRPYQRWAAGIEQHKGLSKQFAELAGNRDESIEAEIDQERKINDILSANVLNAINEVKSRTASVEAQRLADEAANGIMQKYTEKNWQLLKESDALADEYYNMQPDQLAAMIKDGKAGKMGYDVFQKRLADEQAREAAALKMQKDARELSGEAGRKSVPGLVPTAPVSEINPDDVTKAKAISEAKSDLQIGINQLIGYQNTPWAALSSTDRDSYNIQLNQTIGAINSLANAGVLNPGEKANWLESIPKHPASRGVNPVAWGKAMITDEVKVLERMRDALSAQADAKLAIHKFAPAGGAQKPPSPGGADKVRVRLPDGRTGTMPRSGVAAANATVIE